jgi:hypothetical protein
MFGALRAIHQPLDGQQLQARNLLSLHGGVKARARRVLRHPGARRVARDSRADPAADHCAYDASVFVQEEELHRQRREKTLRKQAALFGFQLTPLQTN